MVGSATALRQDLSATAADSVTCAGEIRIMRARIGISTMLVLLSAGASADGISLAGSLWRCTRASDRSQFVITFYLDLPRTLDHGRTEFPASWPHRLAEGADGFHELDRGLMPEQAVRSFTIVQRDDGTPTGPKSARFFIRGTPGPGASSSLMRSSRRVLAIVFAAATMVIRPADWNSLSGCSTGPYVRRCGLSLLLRWISPQSRL
jgi:hypothetical protein